jgi:hypothetical protein
MRGVPLPIIAAQLGHADTRMVEKYYGHLAPSYVAETVRAAFGSLGIVEPPTYWCPLWAEAWANLDRPKAPHGGNTGSNPTGEAV